MKLQELYLQCQKYMSLGYGELEIKTDSEDSVGREIDSIQQNTNPGVEPEYLFLMNK